MSAPTSKPPEGGWGWVVVVCCFYYHVMAGSVYAVSVFYPVWLDQFQESRGVTSWVQSTWMTCIMGFGPVSASLSARLGIRTIVVAGGCIFAAGFLLGAFADSIFLLVLYIGLISGFGCGLCYVPFFIIIARYFEKRRAVAVGIGSSGAGIGAFLTPSLLLYLEEQFTWRGAILIMSGLILNTCVCGLLLWPPEWPESGKSDEEMKPMLRQDKGVYDDIAKTESTAVPALAKTEDTSLRQQGMASGDVKTSNGHCDANLVSGSKTKTKLCLEKQPGSMGWPCLVSSTSNGRNDTKLWFQKKDYLLQELGSGRSVSLKHLAPAEDCEGQQKFSSVNDVHLLPRANGSANQICSTGDITRFGSVYSLIGLGSSFHSGHSKVSLTQSSVHEHQICHSRTSFANTTDVCDRDPLEEDSCLSKCVTSACVYVELMRNAYCLLFSISTFLINLAYLMPSLYMVDRAMENGISKAAGAIALSLFGAGNMIGRILGGWLGDCSCIDRRLLYVASVVVSGASTCLSSLCGDQVVLHAVYATVYGLFTGAYIILTPIVLTDLFGMDKIAQYYGLCLFFVGVSNLIGTPLAGWISDWTGSYTISFILYGCLLMLGASLLVPIVIHIRRRQQSTPERC